MSSVRTGTTPGPTTPEPQSSDSTRDSAAPSMAGRIAMAWAFVGVPLLYGVYETVKKASALFS